MKATRRISLEILCNILITLHIHSACHMFPQYGNLTFSTCLYQFLYMVIILFALYFPLFLYTRYRAVQHTLRHVSVCTVLLPVLYMLIWCVALCHQTVYSLRLLSVSVCNIFVEWYLVCNAWFHAAIISQNSIKTVAKANRNSHRNNKKLYDRKAKTRKFEVG